MEAETTNAAGGVDWLDGIERLAMRIATRRRSQVLFVNSSV
jgi:hypothetical protein